MRPVYYLYSTGLRHNRPKGIKYIGALLRISSIYIAYNIWIIHSVGARTPKLDRWDVVRFNWFRHYPIYSMLTFQTLHSFLPNWKHFRYCIIWGYSFSIVRIMCVKYRRISLNECIFCIQHIKWFLINCNSVGTENWNLFEF